MRTQKSTGKYFEPDRTKVILSVEKQYWHLSVFKRLKDLNEIFLPIFQSSYSRSLRQKPEHAGAALLRSFHWFPKGFKTLLLLGHPRTDTLLSWGHYGEMEALRFDMQLRVIALGGDRFECFAPGMYNCWWFISTIELEYKWKEFSLDNLRAYMIIHLTGIKPIQTDVFLEVGGQDLSIKISAVQLANTQTSSLRFFQSVAQAGFIVHRT